MPFLFLTLVLTVVGVRFSSYYNQTSYIKPVRVRSSKVYERQNACQNCDKNCCGSSACGSAKCGNVNCKCGADCKCTGSPECATQCAKGSCAAK
uniref:Metallothionein 2 n=1 Tax=Libyodrilus violaceus TaxID=3266063 RepID=A0A386IP32_9ANNE|nr:metallothionein 2 [Libyodrilus violaceous]